MPTFRKVAGIVCLTAFMAGCAGGPAPLVQVPQSEMQAYLADKPDRLKPYYERVLIEGKRNEVLNEMRIGTAALDIGETKAAGEAFDKAIGPIEAIYADNETAKKSRRLFRAEKGKEFRGESYERAMVYYYRGILDLMNGDYENARASFKAGLIQDSMAEVEEYKQDFASLAYLSGWASKCNGNPDLASEAFAEAAGYNPALRAPAPGANLLVIAETGFAPRKSAQGKYNELLIIEPKIATDDARASALAGGTAVGLTQAEDLYFQASTRGGRKFDAILAGKAETKATLATMGYVGTGVGLTLMTAGFASGNNNLGYAGLGLAVAGLAAAAVADATKPQADTRYWDNLPGDVHLGTASFKTMPATATLRFATASGQALPSLQQAVAVHHAGACAIAWGRAHRATDIPVTAPNAL